MDPPGMQRHYHTRRDGQRDGGACEDTLDLVGAQEKPDDHVDRQVGEQDRGWMRGVPG